MSISLDELISNKDEGKFNKQIEPRKIKNVIKRPEERVELNKVIQNDNIVVKQQLEPTGDLIKVNAGLNTGDFLKIIKHTNKSSGFLIFDKNTGCTYLALTETCLNANFIYRDDLDIFNYKKELDAWSFYKERGALVDPGVETRKSCYILDNPADETYEVYYDTNYPKKVYGQTTPKGCYIHKYKNRFHRDMAIMELDSLYTQSSKKLAQKLTSVELKDNEAIIISDGASMKGSIASAVYFIDNKSVLKMTQGTLASDKDKASTIAEINGAYNALMMCKAMNKTNIKYYYDNTSILDIFRNRKTEYIEEIKRYKELLLDLYNNGYKVEFIEVHPKITEDKQNDNQAVIYLHNRCDDECRTMCELFTRDYINNVKSNEKVGKTFNEFRQNVKPKDYYRNYR